MTERSQVGRAHLLISKRNALNCNARLSYKSFTIYSLNISLLHHIVSCVVVNSQDLKLHNLSCQCRFSRLGIGPSDGPSRLRPSLLVACSRSSWPRTLIKNGPRRAPGQPTPSGRTPKQERKLELPVWMRQETILIYRIATNSKSRNTAKPHSKSQPERNRTDSISFTSRRGSGCR